MAGLAYDDNVLNYTYNRPRCSQGVPVPRCSMDWGAVEDEAQIHSVCKYGSLADVILLFKRSPALVQQRDQMLQFPLHAACCNHRLYGWKIVKYLVTAYPEAARQADALGRLPLHLAAVNEGPTHDARGLPLWCGLFLLLLLLLLMLMRRVAQLRVRAAS